MAHFLRFRPSVLVVLAFVAGTTLASAQSSSTSGGSSSRSSSSSRSTTTSKTVLPDPALLDGSKQPAEKRPEYGMVGDFELPGDENVRNGKVGGPQNQQPGGGQQQAAGLPGLNLPIPQQGSGCAGGSNPLPSLPQPQQGGGGGGQEQKDGQGQSGTAQASGQTGTGAEASGPQGTADGRQVGQLGGEGAAQDAIAGNKPNQVSIGDKGMRIETTPNPTGVIGEQTGASQHHEKGTGTGGKNATGNNANRGAERGRAIPAGL